MERRESRGEEYVRVMMIITPDKGIPVAPTAFEARFPFSCDAAVLMPVGEWHNTFIHTIDVPLAARVHGSSSRRSLMHAHMGVSHVECGMWNLHARRNTSNRQMGT